MASVLPRSADVLGALLDAVAGGLRELPSIKLSVLPHMADFAAFGEAVGRSLGWPAGKLLTDYYANRRESTASQIEDSPVAGALHNFAENTRIWTGTATELLSHLVAASGKRIASSARWPKSPGRFTNELRRLSPQLRPHGLSITFERDRERRLISLVFVVQ